MRAATSILVLTSALVSAAPTLLSDVAALSVSPGHASAKNSISTRGLLSSVTSTVVGGTLNVIDTLVSSVCDNNYACNVTISGSLPNILGDGANFAGSVSVAAWCSGGHCYGNSNLVGTIPAPALLNITCGGGGACTGVIYGNIDQIFVNANQIELWAWAQPSGYCVNGACVASLTTVGDPAY